MTIPSIQQVCRFSARRIAKSHGQVTPSAYSVSDQKPRDFYAYASPTIRTRYILGQSIHRVQMQICAEMPVFSFSSLASDPRKYSLIWLEAVKPRLSVSAFYASMSPPSPHEDIGLCNHSDYMTCASAKTTNLHGPWDLGGYLSLCVRIWTSF